MLTVLAVALFFVSLIGIVSLFVLKRWEMLHGVVVMPQWRESADQHARILKSRLVSLEGEVSTWWPKTLLIMRYFIHLSALAIARGLRKAEMWMHALADRVSHKHQFERRETRSRFLKEVTNGSKTDGDLDIRQ